jgi:phospholipid/cholesterol/gamma-HCH transport system permease protein
MYEIEALGLNSIGLTAIISIFIGAVITLQMAINLESPFIPKYLIGYATRETMILEFSSTVVALILAGKVGSNIASEIGTMRVTEQIDALRTLSTNPFKYLVAPRIWAGLIVMPLLVLIGDVIGIFGGYVVGVYKLGFNPANYINATLDYLQALDITTGMVKAAVFGFIISLMGCYNGYKSKGGAQGVGAATTNAVVSSSILILIFNYIVTELFFSR